MAQLLPGVNAPTLKAAPPPRWPHSDINLDWSPNPAHTQLATPTPMRFAYQPKPASPRRHRAKTRMPLDLPTEALQRARLSRDPRFDGKFVVAVLSTRIYCRVTCPISPASAVRFYATPAEAEAAGFRPCLRCRPET